MRCGFRVLSVSALEALCGVWSDIVESTVAENSAYSTLYDHSTKSLVPKWGASIAGQHPEADTSPEDGSNRQSLAMLSSGVEYFPLKSIKLVAMHFAANELQKVTLAVIDR